MGQVSSVHAAPNYAVGTAACSGARAADGLRMTRKPLTTATRR